MATSGNQDNTPIRDLTDEVRSISDVSSQHTNRQDNRDLYITPPTYTPLASNGETTVEAETVQREKSTTSTSLLENDQTQEQTLEQAIRSPDNGQLSFYAHDIEGAKPWNVDPSGSPAERLSPQQSVQQAGPVNHSANITSLSTHVDHPPHYFAAPVAEAAMVHVRKCSVLPQCSAVWLVKRRNTALSPLAAAVLLKEGLLRPKDLELIMQTSGDKRDPSDPFSAVTFAIYDAMSDIMLGLVEGPVEFGRQMNPVLAKHHESKKDILPINMQYSMRQTSAPAVRPGTARSTSSSLIEGENDRLLLEPDASPNTAWNHPYGSSNAQAAAKAPTLKSAPRIAGKVALSSGKGVGRIIGASLKAPMTITHGLTRGFHNVPKLYGDEVREYENVVDIRSGLLVSAKGLGYGIGDGIKDFFVKPIEGAEKEGFVGFGKGFAKGIGNLVCKPTAGAAGIVGYSSVGVYKSLRNLCAPSKREVEELAFQLGDAEYAKATENIKTLVVKKWCQMMMRQS